MSFGDLRPPGIDGGGRGEYARPPPMTNHARVYTGAWYVYALRADETSSGISRQRRTGAERAAPVQYRVAGQWLMGTI